MKPEFSTSDVFRTNNTIVSLHNRLEGYKLLAPFKPDGYNSGKYGWNYDIYDINGVRFLLGDREPDMPYKYSTVLLNKYASEMDALDREITASDYKKYREAAEKIIEQFCTSIKKGIHDPAPVTSFSNFKKQLVEQHDMWPEKSYCQISKELLDEVPYSTKTESIKNKINKGIKKEYERVSELQSESASENVKIEFALKVITAKQRKLNHNKEQTQKNTRSR